MKSAQLDARATPERLRVLVEAGVLPQDALQAALDVALGSPPAVAWMAFLRRALLALGAALVLAGVIFFFAFNWAGLGRFGKLALLQGAVVAAALGAWRLWPRATGQMCLTAAAVLVGPLLAVYGQAYQTGADAWELFLGWSALIVPWVVLARSQPLWLLLLLLVNVGLSLFWEQRFGHSQRDGGWLLPVLALLDGAAWLTVEGLGRRGVSWLRGRWLPHVLALLTAAVSLPLALWAAARPERIAAPSALSLLVCLGLAGGLLAFFRGARRDLFLLTEAASLLVALFTTLVGGVLLRSEADVGAMLFMTLLLVAELTCAAWWLRGQARQGPVEDA